MCAFCGLYKIQYATGESDKNVDLFYFINSAIIPFWLWR